MNNKKAQTALEYLLLLMAVAAIILIGFKTYMPAIQETANVFYNRAAPAILGKPSRCGDGICSSYEEHKATCPPDCEAEAE